MLREDWIKLWGLEMQPMQCEHVCFKVSKNILQEILDWRAREGCTRQHSRFGQLRHNSNCVGLNWLCCLARPSLALQSRISCKIFLESLKHTRSPCIGPISRPQSFISSSLSILWHLQGKPHGALDMNFTMVFLSWQPHPFLALLNFACLYWNFGRKKNISSHF